MNPEISQLHRLRWAEACNSAKAIISSSDEAKQSINQLLSTGGWRDRYSAAIVTTAFRLNDQITQLVENFKAAPEFHVCQACTYMISDLLGAKGVSHLQSMKSACSTSDRDLAIIKSIDDAIQNLPLA